MTFDPNVSQEYKTKTEELDLVTKTVNVWFELVQKQGAALLALVLLFIVVIYGGYFVVTKLPAVINIGIQHTALQRELISSLATLQTDIAVVKDIVTSATDLENSRKVAVAAALAKRIDDTITAPMIDASGNKVQGILSIFYVGFKDSIVNLAREHYLFLDVLFERTNGFPSIRNFGQPILFSTLGVFAEQLLQTKRLRFTQSSEKPQFIKEFFSYAAVNEVQLVLVTKRLSAEKELAVGFVGIVTSKDYIGRSPLLIGSSVALALSAVVDQQRSR